MIERFQQIEELYHAAREGTAEERAALLAKADPELRREVESLLAQRTGGEFLDRPAIQNDPQLLGDSTLTGLAVGASLGPYRIESKLGEGGMGEVYRAMDTRLGRAVAVKIVQKQFIGRFEREARAISSLNHPHICTLYDVGPDYLVMELVEGETIVARLRSGVFPLKTALLYGSQILAALTEAHEKGIVHRDLKPGNIMIAKSGIKVLDFGLAKSGHDEVVTASGMVLGTPAYMAPEQREGKPADSRSDIYSFGCVLYEMLTGARIGSQRRRLPSIKLERIIGRCLEEDPDRRWQSAAELQRELAGVTTTGSRGKHMLAAAAAILALSTAAYVYFHRAPGLTDKDTIVLADFTNTTGDSVFDGTLRQGLSIQLEQSPFLSLISDQQIQQTLSLMGQKPDAKLTPEIARELCQRTGSGAVLGGSIAQIGTPYLLTMKAVNCSNGETLASTEAQASDKNHVLDALGKTASEMRNKLGESLSTVKKFNTPLEEATTPSLDALKAFSSGIQYHTDEGDATAIASLKHAVELDANFALAYAWLQLVYTNIGEPSVAAQYAQKAYDLRERTSEPEKYFIMSRYYKAVTGNMDKAEQVCLLWKQTYPRSAMPHTHLSGSIYPITGQFEKGVEEGRQAIRLSPDFAPAYGLPLFDLIALNRLDEAKAIYQQAMDRKLKYPGFHLFLYEIAFLQNDAAGMAQQVASTAGKPGIEPTLLANEADTAAFFGRLKQAREFSRRAVDSAMRSSGKEMAETISATWALQEALFGNAEEARTDANSVGHSEGLDVRYGSALALAYAGDDKRVQTLADNLGQRFPEATIVQFNYLPTLHAKTALLRGNASAALEALSAASPYELGYSTYSTWSWTAMYPVYVRGEAYLAAHQGSKAVAEFQKILDHRGIVWNSPIGALAHLQLGRAYAMQSDTAKARDAYNDFLTLWKDADPDIPVLNQAKAEYASLH